jgi:hypothetical protein
MASHAIGQQLVADGDGLGLAGRPGRQDDPAEVVLVRLRHEMWLERLSIAFRPGQISENDPPHIAAWKPRRRNRRVDLDRNRDVALAHGEGDHPQPRQRQENGGMKNDIRNIHGNDAALRQAERVNLP